MLTFLIALGAAWCLYRWLKSKPTRTTIATHRLSDRDTLVVVEKGDQFWCGLYSKDEVRQTDTVPDWYSNFRRN